MAPPDTVAQDWPPLTVAKAGPVPSNPLVVMADVVTLNVWEPLVPTAKSTVPKAVRLNWPPALSVIVPGSP